MKTILETDRLVAREFLPTDAPLLFKLNSDPKVIEFTGDNAFKSEQEALKTINETIIVNQYQKDGFGRWAIHLRANGLFIGWCGLRRLENSNEIDLGYRLHKRFWNKGMATEIANAVLQYGFNELELPEIMGRSAKENIASIRVLEKIGMKFEKDIMCMKYPASQFKISKEEFLKSVF